MLTFFNVLTAIGLVLMFVEAYFIIFKPESKITAALALGIYTSYKDHYGKIGALNAIWVVICFYMGWMFMAWASVVGCILVAVMWSYVLVHVARKQTRSAF